MPAPSGRANGSTANCHPEESAKIHPATRLKHHTDGGADRRQHHKLDQEHKLDLTWGSTDCEAQADLLLAFENAHQHDIHDADAADHKGNGTDRQKQTA